MLFEAGPATATGFGEAPISWTEIINWLHLTGNQLTPAEAVLLRRLSQVYAAARSTLTEADAPAPYRLEDEAAKDADKIESVLTSFFGAMSRKV